MPLQDAMVASLTDLMRRLPPPPHARSEQDRAAGALAALEIPLQYLTATIDNFETTSGDAGLLRKKKQLAERFIACWADRVHNPRFPMLSVWTGQTGTGKTHLAYGVCRALAERHGVRARVTTCGALIRELRASWRKGSSDEAEAKVIARYLRYELLVLDEISSHALYGEPWQHLYDIVAPREAELRPTILITNEPPGAFEALLGPAIVSRGARYGGPWDFGTFDVRRGANLPRVTYHPTTTTTRG